MRIRTKAANIQFTIETATGERVLDVEYENYTFDLNLEKGAEAVSALMQKFDEVAAQIKAATSTLN